MPSLLSTPGLSYALLPSHLLSSRKLFCGSFLHGKRSSSKLLSLCVELTCLPSCRLPMLFSPNALLYRQFFLLTAFYASLCHWHVALLCPRFLLLPTTFSAIALVVSQKLSHASSTPSLLHTTCIRSNSTWNFLLIPFSINVFSLSFCWIDLATLSIEDTHSRWSLHSVSSHIPPAASSPAQHGHHKLL